jgi:hypothetical protein
MEIFEDKDHEMEKAFVSKLIKTSDAVNEGSFLSGLSLLQLEKTVKQLRKGGPGLDCLNVAISLDLFRIDLQNLLFVLCRQQSKNENGGFPPLLK